MAVYTIHGRIAFNSAGQRNSYASRIETEATARGFTPAPYDEYPAGVVPSTTEAGNAAVAFSYVHDDYPAIEAALTDLDGLSRRGGRKADRGDYLGSGMISETMTVAEYLNLVT